MCVWVGVYVCVCACVCVYDHTNMWNILMKSNRLDFQTHVCKRLTRMYIHVLRLACIYIPAHKHRHRHRNRDTDKDRHKY